METHSHLSNQSPFPNQGDCDGCPRTPEVQMFQLERGLEAGRHSPSHLPQALSL